MVYKCTYGFPCIESKQCAAVNTNFEEMRLPPQPKNSPGYSSNANHGYASIAAGPPPESVKFSF